MSAPITDVSKMRALLIKFVTSNGGQARRDEMRKHVGIDGTDWCGVFDRAVKTKHLVPIHGTGEVSPGLFLSRPPVVAYRLAAIVAAMQSKGGAA